MLLQANSVECGMNTGCLKIFKKAEGFDHNGNFIPPHKRGTDIQLFRGKHTDIQLFRGKQTDIQLFIDEERQTPALFEVRRQTNSSS
jgi:hypothetical protein